MERLKMLELNKLYNMDCMDGMKEIRSKSIDLIVIDPPYNIGKDKRWDKWKTIELYVEFMGGVFKECERILKDNGSFYFFHNDFLQIVELQNYIKQDTKFIFKQLITWDKGDFRALAWKNPSEECELRNWFPTSEYCLFYTFQDDLGLNNFLLKKKILLPIQNYLIDELKKTKLTHIEIGKILSQSHTHYFDKTERWRMPCFSQYLKLQSTGFFKREYESLRQEYESLRQEYESLRYTFNLFPEQKNIWTIKSKNNGKLHPTQKPIEIIEKIIRTSSKPDDIVLDCFMGSGTTAIACINTNRNFIGMERDKIYFDVANKRIEEHKAQIRWEL